MKKTIPSLACALLLHTTSQCVLAGEVELFNGFETAADLSAVAANGSEVQATTEGTTQGKQALRIQFMPGSEWPNAAFATPVPWNWERWGVLVVDVSNPGPESVEVGIGAGDISAGGKKGWSSGSATLPPGSSATLGFPLLPPAAESPLQDIGMDGMPSLVPQLQQLRAYGDTLDRGRIGLFTLFTRSPKAPTAVVVDNIRLAPAPRLNGIVDRYGQYTGTVWPGKVLQDGDLTARGAAEEADWKLHPPARRSRYGGWLEGPRLQGTGHFRTERHQGKWWLVDPEGYLFFSTGITTINHNEPQDQYTRLAGREALFTWLPQSSNPFDARHTSVRGNQSFFNFYQANLERKYGPDFETAWLGTVASRLRSWGFNTVGDFSSPKTHTLKIPYCVTMGAWGGHRRVKGENIDIDDPFDSQFAADLSNNLRSLAPYAPADPYCIGYFVDNELTWGGTGTTRGPYSITLAVLAGPADQPAKQALLRELRTRYADITALNAAWRTEFPDWTSLQPAFSPTAQQEAAMRGDLLAFMKVFATQYYRTVRDTVKAFDPNHLYLGDKYMVARYTPEALEAALTYCDVVSFDIYEADVSTPKWDFLKGLNKPSIIGEFHFGALDRGMFGAGMISAASQAERAAAYEKYVRSVARHPAFVGCHWFQYLDQPLTARAFDRENHNVGFVTGTDTPYPELIAAARRANAQVYSWRSQ